MAETETSTQRGFLDFSPVKRDDDNDKENDVPVLSLIQFSKAPFVSFGTVKLGTSKSAVLRIENPAEDAEAEVRVEKIPSGRGFSVDRSAFTIQPEGSSSLTVTWTPAEEGGTRELLVFNANGVLKHQAVLLGRAEAPRKKKKSLWDTIKNRREGERVAAPRGKKTERPLKMAANKTFQVSRRPQYRRDKPRSPLASLNARERSLTKLGPDGEIPRKPEERPASSPKPRRPSLASSDQENVSHVQSDSPLVLLVPATKLTDPGCASASPDTPGMRPEHKELTRILNRTLSPIGTPEGLKRVMLRIQSESPVPSLKDALALIGSDLSHVNSSPRDTSGCGFSDSLESGADAAESNEPRLTFFVRKKVVVTEAEQPGKKASFTSATVTKSKAPAEGSGPSGRKTKKSRRRLLEKTLELSDSSGSRESGPDTPKLPVIEPEASSVPRAVPEFSSFGSASLVASISFTVTPASLSPLPLAVPSDLCEQPPPVQEDSFPVLTAARSKKRKCEEFLKGDAKAEDAGKTKRVKRSKVAAGKAEPRRPERRSASQRTADSAPSLRSRRSAAPAPAKPPRGAPSLKPSAASSLKTAKTVKVAQSRLTFVRPTQTAIPRHPMPFAAKNMFYDERWMEKQERGFTWWINYVLTPDDFKVNTEVAKAKAVSLAMGSVDGVSVLKAPTKEEMSFSTYTARRKLNRLRRSACALFTSDAMAKAIRRLELEVEARRLLVRRDRHLWKDVGERRKVLNWLLSYNPLWLRIGLETIYGELISLESNSDAVGLAVFILRRLLWNPDIAAEFRHAKVPHLYRDGHEEALSRFTLKKLLLLVCFLDRAKESRLIEHDPCLFCVDAEFKTSKDLLLAFSRDFLSGEGILPRHLGYLGLPVSHAQTPLDEFSFAVKNLAVDLKCGVRLVRVTELLVQDWSLSAKLRLPAISRLQKVHNVDVALHALKSKGVDLRDEHGAVIDSRDVVDGHREKTLSLLWKIIFAFQVEAMLDEDQLRDEVGFLRTTLRTKRRLASLRADRGLRPDPVGPSAPYKLGGPRIGLLMDWVRAVCDFYDLKVQNFTVAFSDGRVLCHLVHHYHPGLLPAAAVAHATTQTLECSAGGQLELGGSDGDSDSSFDPSGADPPSLEFKELLENERNNFRLVNAAVSFLGGVPAMISAADMSNTIPDEKVVMSYLTFLCARLLDLRKETRAARVIQGAWRKYRLEADLRLYQRRNAAALKLQSAARRFLQRRRTERRNRAAVAIQSAWRGHAARRRLWLMRAARAASVIQDRWRTLAAARAFRRLRRHAVAVQAQWRMRRAASAYGRTRWAAVVLQRRWRARVLARRERERYLSLRAAAVKLQRGYRRWRARKTERENAAATTIQAAFRKWREEKTRKRGAAAVRIQSWFRMRRCVRRYRAARRGAVLIQARYRGHAQRRRFEALRLRHRAAVVIQAAVRMLRCRRRYVLLQSAAVVVQCRYRAVLLRRAQQNQYRQLRRAAVTIQAAYRGFRAREELRKRRDAATAIQAQFRMHRTRVAFLAIKCAAVIVQERYRAKKLGERELRRYRAVRSAAVVVQAAYRGRAARRRVAEMRQAAAVVLQAAFRGWSVRRDVGRRNRAAAVIQSRWRCFVQRRDFLRKREAVVTLQRRVRAVQLGRAARDGYATARRAAVTLQRCCRAWIARRKALEAARAERRRRFAAAAFHHLSAARIQRAFRAHRALESARRQIQSVVTIQRWVRARQQRRRFLRDQRNVVVAQRAVRRWLARRHQAASVIQRAVRGFLLLRRQRRAERGIVKAQALWRGHRSRRLNDNPAVAKLRLRLRQVSAAVRDEDRLCNKTASALDYLLRYKHFSYILEALRNLETATRLSPECCERLAESGATATIFTLIRCCNRSVPCMDVIAFSVQILLNLSKYHETAGAVYSAENSVETLLDLLQRYREKAGDKVAEKGGSIFTKACFLLVLLLQDRRRAAEVTKLPKVLERVRGVYRLTARKHKMDADRAAVRQKMSAPMNGSFFVQATPRKPRLPPRFAPDWVLRKDKLKDVVDPLRAISMVADALSITL